LVFQWHRKVLQGSSGLAAYIPQPVFVINLQGVPGLNSNPYAVPVNQPSQHLLQVAQGFPDCVSNNIDFMLVIMNKNNSRNYLATRTGLEPVAFCVTGRRSNQLI
jgi:hypothetical protein